MYFTIVGKVEEANDASYTRSTSQRDGSTVEETVQRIELSLTIPSMRDRVRVTMTPEVSPKSDQLDKWELDETWVVVSADSMRANAFEGSKGAAAIVAFNAVEVREATNEERAKLQQARKANKQKSKAARAQRKADRDAHKKAAQAAA